MCPSRASQYGDSDDTIYYQADDGDLVELNNPGNDREKNKYDEYDVAYAASTITIINPKSDGWCFDQMWFDNQPILLNNQKQTGVWLDNPCEKWDYARPRARDSVAPLAGLPADRAREARKEGWLELAEGHKAGPSRPGHHKPPLLPAGPPVHEQDQDRPQDGLGRAEAREGRLGSPRPALPQGAHVQAEERQHGRPDLVLSVANQT